MQICVDFVAVSFINCVSSPSRARGITIRHLSHSFTKAEMNLVKSNSSKLNKNLVLGNELINVELPP